MKDEFRIAIKNLFDERNYDIKFSNKINVLVGENGCGKTNILRILNSILNKDYSFFIRFGQRLIIFSET